MTTLTTMLETGVAVSRDGEEVPIHSGIDVRFADALQRSVVDQKPRVVLEVGMAFGISSLAILSGLDENGGGTLISIDPHQNTDWRGCGVEAVRRAGYEHLHTLIEEPDYLALPTLLRNGTDVDFAYIDGWHTFDYALIDFWYVDKMLPPGGVVAFNDSGFLAVDRVIRFILSHRLYAELDVVDVKLGPGLSVPAPQLGLAARASRRLLKRGLVQHQDRYFRKTDDWEPNWNFYAEF